MKGAEGCDRRVFGRDSINTIPLASSDKCRNLADRRSPRSTVLDHTWHMSHRPCGRGDMDIVSSCVPSSHFQALDASLLFRNCPVVSKPSGRVRTFGCFGIERESEFESVKPLSSCKPPLARDYPANGEVKRGSEAGPFSLIGLGLRTPSYQVDTLLPRRHPSSS
jgi:hypothetical protein